MKKWPTKYIFYFWTWHCWSFKEVLLNSIIYLSFWNPICKKCHLQNVDAWLNVFNSVYIWHLIFLLILIPNYLIIHFIIVKHWFTKLGINIPDSKVHGANMGHTWGRQDPGGPHVGHMNFAIWGNLSSALVISSEWASERYIDSTAVHMTSQVNGNSTVRQLFWGQQEREQ